jgi:cell division protein FtsB
MKMENYKVYRNLKWDLQKKKVKLADLKKKSTEIKSQIINLEVEIEENINGLNMVFDTIISQKS